MTGLDMDRDVAGGETEVGLEYRKLRYAIGRLRGAIQDIETHLVFCNADRLDRGDRCYLSASLDRVQQQIERMKGMA